MLSKSSLTLSDGRIYFAIPNDKENESKIKATYTRINKWFSTYSHELSLDCVWLKNHLLRTLTAALLLQMANYSIGQTIRIRHIAISIRIINARASTNQWNRSIRNDLFDTWNGITTIQASRKKSFYSIWVHNLGMVLFLPGLRCFML